jgi:hypothetical protein
MPTIFQERGYRFYFYEADLSEPIHVHIAKSGNQAKFWISPVRLAVRGEFKDYELNQIERIIANRYAQIVAAWQEEEDKRNNR